jgi:ferredoxin-NADP reductase
MTASGPALLDVCVTDLRTVAAGVCTVELSADRPLPAWTPGAHLDVHLPGDLLRQYSLCSDPAEATYRIGVLREPNSRGGSSYVHEHLRVGDRLQISAPRNNFALEQSPAHLFIAGGIGITPILPMVHEADRCGTDWRLLYGGRSAASMAFTDDLIALDAGRGRVVLHPQDTGGLLPLRAWLDEPSGDTLVHCCGPAPMLNAVEYETLLWPARALRVERFTPRPVPPPARTTAFVVELARTGRSVTVQPDVSVLDAVSTAGLGMLSSCKQGLCGTCVTRVLEGIPDHRDSILTAADRENGDRMYLCVSRSCSDRLVLDL